MAEFLEVALSYPTLPYSVVLSFAVIYWLLAATGIVDDGGIGGGDGADFHSHGGTHGATGLAGMLAGLGFTGVPTMLVVLLVSYFGWTFTYLTQLYFLQGLPQSLRWGIGTVVAALAIVPGAMVSSWLLRPIRRLFMKLRPIEQESILGKTGEVASPEVTDTHGYANVDDGGAGLILQIRARSGQRYARGDRVRLVQYMPKLNCYLVAGESELPALDGSHTQVSRNKEID